MTVDPDDDPDLSVITMEHPLYSKLLDFRYNLLRKPLGMMPGSEKNKLDASSLHLLFLHDSEVIGCVSLCSQGEYTGKVFQMAVCRELQGKGLGFKLLQHCITIGKKQKIPLLWLNARDNAMRFYERSGFKETGSFFIEVGVTHKRMELLL
ncbi:hypothetical protein P9112_006325 [Eukaryota sp. TZLM1-RC]